MKNLLTATSFLKGKPCYGFSYHPRQLNSFLMFIIPVLLVLQSNISMASDSCVNASCHPDMGKAKYVHEPVTDYECDACHIETGNNHPEEKGAFEFAEKGPTLCLQCHDDPSKGNRHVHPPIQDDCTNCHNPHQGSQPKFLHKSLGALCLMCHDQIKKIIADATSAHEPVKEGECLNCHVPHAGDHKPLLILNYPREGYTRYSDRKFALCFKCHESEAFTLRQTTGATNFRNGDRNLHFVHVNRAKGRTCVNCHNVHGGAQAKLIHKESPPFGAWNFPITITMTDTGATCFVGCHKEKSYDRGNKVTTP
jgi:predicted CXXCH cytochrome family protein